MKYVVAVTILTTAKDTLPCLGSCRGYFYPYIMTTAKDTF